MLFNRNFTFNLYGIVEQLDLIVKFINSTSTIVTVNKPEKLTIRLLWAYYLITVVIL